MMRLVEELLAEGSAGDMPGRLGHAPSKISPSCFADKDKTMLVGTKNKARFLRLSMGKNGAHVVCADLLNVYSSYVQFNEVASTYTSFDESISSNEQDMSYFDGCSGRLLAC